MQPDQTVIDRWSCAAPLWEKHRDVISHMFAPVGQALVDDAGIAGGHTVLDVATGPGEPALAIAQVVGPEGRVVGVDPVAGMVQAAQRAADRLGLRNAHFEVGSGEQLPFPDATFDAVVSRFGVMFFPSPVDGVREIARVLKPGRKLALAVWAQPDANPFFHSIQRVLDRYAEPAPLDPDAPDGFRFAMPGKLKSVFTQAGVSDVSERVLRFSIEAPVPVEDYWTLRTDMSEKIREKIATLTSEQQVAVKHEAIEALRAYSTVRGMSFPSEVLIVSGRK